MTFYKLSRTIIFKSIFAAWIILWAVFLIREDKDDQYKAMRYFYTHDREERTAYMLGDDLHSFLAFCRDNIPEGSTYGLKGFGRFSIKEVRARYFLWPLKDVEEDPDYIVVYGAGAEDIAGYEEYRRYGASGRILARKGAGA